MAFIRNIIKKAYFMKYNNARYMPSDSKTNEGNLVFVGSIIKKLLIYFISLLNGQIELEL